MAVQLLPGPFTVEMYHRLAELGILDEDDRVELLDGQVVEMTPVGGRHSACVYRLSNLLSRRGIIYLLHGSPEVAILGHAQASPSRASVYGSPA